MAGQVINGGDLMLFIDGKSIAFATSHKLSINVETVETTSKDSGGKWVAKAARKIIQQRRMKYQKGDGCQLLLEFIRVMLLLQH